MKVLLIYYTGTYNTRFLSDELQNALTVRGHQVDRVEINCETQPVNTEGYDMVGFSYPIYGFNSPGPFNRFIKKKLTCPRGQKFFIYKNSGETLAMNNASSRILLHRMKRKKGTFCGEYHFVMPYNIHFKFDRAFVREILQKDEKLMRILVDDIENGRVKKIKSKWIYNFAAAFVRIVNIAGDINSFFYKVDKDKCVQCMKCVRDCPEKNVRFEKGKIKFGHNCDMCMRCSFLCPTDAIKIGFLDSWGWRVNGDYKLKELKKDTSPVEPYITEKSEGFYKCYIKTFAEIDAEYERLFGATAEVAVAQTVEE